jgi:3-methyladenine DNA glycosylase Tag
VPISPEHRRIARPRPADYLAVMSRAVFQAGLSWAAIDRQWSALLSAFEAFEPRRVARYGTRDIARIMAHPGILHSERKIAATIRNAQTIVALEREHGSMRSYLRSFDSYDALAADLKRRFSHVGDVSAYYFLYRVGERVPPFSKWIATVKGDHPRIKEMVATR